MSAFPIRQRIENAAYRLPKSATRALGSLPGPRASWLLGQGAEFLRNDGPHLAEQFARYGPLFVMPLPFGARAVVLTGAEANRLVLGNAGKQFSNHWAYRRADLFGDSIVTRDFDDHYELRRLVAGAFSPGALQRYLDVIHDIVARHMSALPRAGGVVPVYPFAKRIALTIAANVFAGLDLGDDPERITDALAAVLAMPGLRMRLPIPGTAYRHALRERARVQAFFAARVGERRHGTSADLFSLLCRAENERGERLADAEIVDNVVGAMIAGHDTSTIAMASLAWELARNPAWQERLRQEAANARAGSGRISFAGAAGLVTVEWCVNEVLRLYTPIRYIGRRTVADCQFAGKTIPANTDVLLSVHHAHHDAGHFSEPESFRPERFSGRDDSLGFDPHGFAPFGSGAHRCLGIAFAMLEIKVFVSALLARYRVEPCDEAPLRVEGLPVSKPTTAVPLRLSPL